MQSGGCRCGKIRYEVEGEPEHSALCHCADCRASSGAPAMAWTAFKDSQFTLKAGDPATFEGKNGALRQFCAHCGTGLFYRNADMLPGIIDIQSATLDDQDAFPAQAHIQCAERLPWMARLDELPEFERYPGA